MGCRTLGLYGFPKTKTQKETTNMQDYQCAVCGKLFRNAHTFQVPVLAGPRWMVLFVDVSLSCATLSGYIAYPFIRLFCSFFLVNSLGSPPPQGTIKSRLLSMSYTTPEEFASDVRLVFKNAIGFNPDTHFVHTWAVQLLNDFDVSPTFGWCFGLCAREQSLSGGVCSIQAQNEFK